MSKTAVTARSIQPPAMPATMPMSDPMNDEMHDDGHREYQRIARAGGGAGQKVAAEIVGAQEDGQGSAARSGP